MHGWKVNGEGASPENCDLRRTESMIFSDLEDEFWQCNGYQERPKSLPRHRSPERPKSLPRYRQQGVQSLPRNRQTL